MCTHQHVHTHCAFAHTHAYGHIHPHTYITDWLINVIFSTFSLIERSLLLSLKGDHIAPYMRHIMNIIKIKHQQYLFHHTKVSHSLSFSWHITIHGIDWCIIMLLCAMLLLVLCRPHYNNIMQTYIFNICRVATKLWIYRGRFSGKIQHLKYMLSRWLHFYATLNLCLVQI